MVEGFPGAKVRGFQGVLVALVLKLGVLAGLRKFRKFWVHASPRH